MNIHRNNYEEYFLLYADNELSAAEKKEVEIFVRQNGDLEEEFRLIQLTVNVPDENTSLADKTFLLKNEPSSFFIHENNYEEIFVLYHDDELSAQQKKQTEEFLKDHPRFNIDFELIGKSKLAADENIVFPGKSLLYKKEKAGKVISIILWRSVAAAVFIGLILWAGLFYFNQKEGMRAVAIEKNTLKPLYPTKGTIEQKQDTAAPVTPALAHTEVAAKEKKTQDLGSKKIMRVQSINSLTKTDEKKDLVKEPKINVVTKKDDPMLALNNDLKNSADEIRTKSLPAITQPQVDEQQNIVPSEYAQNASYLTDNNSNNENYIFYNVKANEFNKSKVGGFLKKVKRIVERTNPIGRILAGEDKQVAAK